jgi:hypothetical protein
MALTRQQSVHTYQSASGGQTYSFEVVVDAQGTISVRNILTPTGGICDPYTTLPQTVMDDIAVATELAALLQLESEVDSGNIVFAGVASVAVVIPGGTLNNTNYRVIFTTPDGTLLEATGKTITGFTAEAAAVYGTIAAPVTVGYSVLVKTAQTSDLSGVLTIADTDAGSKAIVFATPLTTANYRVLLEPRGFFDAHVPTVTKLKTGFTIELGHVPPAASSVDVGYDVFV